MMKYPLISIAVADLRKEPQDLFPRDFSHHPLRESQLLYGERIRIIEEKEEWLKVEAIEQERFTKDQKWHPYPGWIHRSEITFAKQLLLPTCVVCVPWASFSSLPFHLSYGTFLHYLDQETVLLPNGEKAHCDPKAIRPFPYSFSRETLIEDARHFLGAPYLWGGRASYGEKGISGVDCSGLVNILHRGQGILIPRDAHDQFLKARKILPSELQLGDSIYLSREGKPERITHVVLYTGPSTFLEAPETGKDVRSLAFLSPLGERVHLEDRSHPYHAHYGSFFSH